MKYYKQLQEKINSIEFEDFFDRKILGSGINYEKKMKYYRFFDNIIPIIFILNFLALYFFIGGRRRRYYAHSFAEYIGIPPEICTLAIIIIIIIFILCILYFCIISKSDNITNKMFDKLSSFFNDIHIKTLGSNSFRNMIRNAKCLPSFDNCYTSKELKLSYRGMIVNMCEFSLTKEPALFEKHEKPVLKGLCIVINCIVDSDKGGVIITTKGNSFFKKNDLDTYYKKMKILEYDELCQNYNIYASDKESMQNTLDEVIIKGLIELQNNKLLKENDIVISFNYDSKIYIIIKDKVNDILINSEDYLTDISMYKQKLNNLLSYLAIVDELELNSNKRNLIKQYP